MATYFKISLIIVSNNYTHDGCACKFEYRAKNGYNNTQKCGCVNTAPYMSFEKYFLLCKYKNIN